MQKTMNSPKFWRELLDSIEARDALRAQLKDVEHRVHVMLRTACDNNAAGRHDVDGKQIDISQILRNSVSWKELCHSAVPVAKINALLPDFTTVVEVLNGRIV